MRSQVIDRCPCRMRQWHRAGLHAAVLLAAFAGSRMYSQAAPAASPQSRQITDIENRLNEVTAALAQTQKALQQSLIDIEHLRTELNAMRQTNAALPPPSPATASSSSVEAQIAALHEQQEVLQAEIKQHDQTKVETESKYSLKVTGLVLFNAFSTAGVVDNAELPSLALPRNPGSSHGSLGASVRQTVFGVAATGPMIGGAQTSATLNADFFGGTTTNAFGYATPEGYVRMRDSQLSLDWSKTTLQLGYTNPLISPLSPTSYATVAQPALSYSGNLWAWSPQIKLEQRVPLVGNSGFALEAGLISPISPIYNSVQLDSPIEASRRPAVEGRISYHADNTANSSPHSLDFGVGAYTANQFYNSTNRIHSWAVTGDWRIPLSHYFDLSGEVYRGNSLGGLGGGVYKDILTGTDPITGLSRTVGVDTAGGWAQLKLNMGQRFEANSMFGLDDAFASSFRSVILPSGSGALIQSARNSTITGNVIFRPRSSLFISPEYRRLLTWRITGAPYSANIFTLSAGYQF